MKALVPLLLLVAFACSPDPGPGELTGTISPEAEGRRVNETDPTPQNNTALSGTFGGDAPGHSPGPPATATATTGTTATTP